MQREEDEVMRHPNPISVRGHAVAIIALLLATALGGCVAYTAQPASRYSYGYGYPAGYYTEYPTYSSYPNTYAYSYNYRPYYSPDYNSYNNTYATSGGGER